MYPIEYDGQFAGFSSTKLYRLLPSRLTVNNSPLRRHFIPLVTRNGFEHLFLHPLPLCRRLTHAVTTRQQNKYRNPYAPTEPGAVNQNPACWPWGDRLVAIGTTESHHVVQAPHQMPAHMASSGSPSIISSGQL